MSKRVTKAMAHIAAVELAKKAYGEKIEKAETDFRDFGLELYHKYIPEELRDALNKYMSFFMDTQELKFIVVGASSWDYKRIYYEELKFPYFEHIIVSPEDWSKLKRLDSLQGDLSSEKFQYEFDCEQALINLRTEKNVQEQFPEALPYLNFTECTALVPCLDNLRNKLK